MANYEKLANGAVVCGVLSAAMFDHSTSWWRLVFGTIGIACAVFAAALYFYQRRSDTSKNRRDGASTAQEHYISSLMASHPFKDADLEALHVENVNSQILFYDHSVPYEAVVETGSEHLGALHVSVFDARKRRKHGSDEIVEIVERLCAERSDDSFEFVIAPDGTFTIKRPGRAKSIESASVVHPPSPEPTEVAAEHMN